MTYFSLFQLIVISIAAHIALAGARVTTSLYALSLHASEFTVGILIALFAVFPMLLSVSMGKIIDRIGIKRPMSFGCFCVATGCALSGISDSLITLFLTVPLIGTGFMAVHIGSQHAVGALSTRADRAGNFGWLSLGFSVSSLIGPVLAGVLIDHASFSIAYLVCCGSALLALGLIAGGHLDHIKPETHAKPPKKCAMFELLHDREMRKIYFVSVLLAAAWDLFTFMTPIQGSKMGLSASMIGLVFGTFSAATFAVRLVMPWLRRRYTEWEVLTGALLMATSCYALFPFAQQALTLMGIAALLGFALGSSQPNVLALLHQAAPSGRGAEAIGIRATIGNASQVMLPIVFGSIGATIGTFAIFWGMSAVIACGVIPSWRKATSDSEPGLQDHPPHPPHTISRLS